MAATEPIRPAPARSTMVATAARGDPCTVPRQPAWAAARPAARRVAEDSGRQSAVKMASGRPRGRSPGRRLAHQPAALSARQARRAVHLPHVRRWPASLAAASRRRRAGRNGAAGSAGSRTPGN